VKKNVTDPIRLKDEGPEAQQVLLRAAPPEMPLGLKESVRARVEGRMQGGNTSRTFMRLAFAASLVLVAGGAMAYGVAKARHFLQEPQNAASPLRLQQAPRIGSGTTQQAIVLPHSNSVGLQAESSTKHARRKTHLDAPPQSVAMLQPPRVATAAPAAPSIESPPMGLHDFREFPEGKVEAMVPAEAPSSRSPHEEPPRPGRLLVNWASRRGASLDVVDMYGQGDALARVFGTINRTPLSIEIRKGLLVGKIGDEVVNVWLKGKEQADGSIAGYDVDFKLSATQNGYLLRGNLPGHTARLELHKGILRWYPGCENALAATSPGVYQGTCTEGKNASVVLPPSFRKLPPLARLVMLAIILTDRDPVFQDREPQIFNATP